MAAKSAAGLVIAALFALPLGAFLRRRERSSPEPATASFEEIRQRLETAKANYRGSDPEAFARAIDAKLAALQASYGERVPVAEGARLAREVPVPDAGSHTLPTLPPADSAQPPTGIAVERTPDGFLLRASCGSLVTGAMYTLFAALLVAIPLRLWGGLIRGFWSDEGLSFWLTGLLLAAWAGGILYVATMAAMGFFGEIRIAKAGDSGGIFTGIGKAGWTRRIRWSQFEIVAEREAATSASRSHRTIRYVALIGPGKSYKFGSDLTLEQRAFVIEFLREQAFAAQR